VRVRRKKKDILRVLISYVIIWIFTLIALFPFIIALSTSFKSMYEIRNNPYSIIPDEFHFENYANAMQRGNWARYFANSTFITVITTVVSLLTNSIAGYSFSRLHFKGRNILFRFSLLGMMVPIQMIMIPVFLQIKAIPLAGGNNIFGLGGTGLLNNIWGIIVPLLAGPFGVFLCKQFYESFPTSLDEAAKIDGCSNLRIYISIYLPLSGPVLATLAILKATDSWNQYTWPLIITNSEEGRTVQLALSMFRGSTVIDWNLLMAATFLICIPVLILFLSLQKYYVKGVITSGIKA
jgi:multiple sugar transport system permease protein